jgi:ribose transport system ATP-binding protein
MVGRTIDDLYPRGGRPADGELVLETRDLAGEGQPLSATLALRRGRVLGIAGLIGSGRTALLRTLFGLAPVRSGAVRIGDVRGAASPRTRWHSGAGYVSEDRKREGLAVRLSVADNVTLPRLEGLGPGRLVMPHRQAAAARQWIGRLGVKCTGPEVAISSLSGGNQQKAALARLLHADVDVLLLDEPTRGIDVGSKAEIYRLIDGLARGDAAAGRAPKAILLVSSYLPELLGTCDEIAVMCRGRLSATRPAAEWDERQLMLAATGQEESAG